MAGLRCATRLVLPLLGLIFWLCPDTFALRPEPHRAGLEEQFAIQGLDASDQAVRVQAIRSLVEVERQGHMLPHVGPKLPSYIHVHTTASYPGLEGVASPSRVLWAAHRANQTEVFLIEHETLEHVEEAQQAADVINAWRVGRGLAPLQVALGIEFAAPDAGLPWLEQAPRTAGRSDFAWVYAVVPTRDERAMTRLRELVEQFQAAKHRRATLQVAQLNDALGIALTVPEGNITERRLVVLAARAMLPAATSSALEAEAARIRRHVMGPAGAAHVPYAVEQGFPRYENLVPELARMGAMPTFTMQVAPQTLETLLPFLIALGIRAVDVAGIEPHWE